AVARWPGRLARHGPRRVRPRPRGPDRRARGGRRRRWRELARRRPAPRPAAALRGGADAVRITRLQLRNVRRHADLDLALAPGLAEIREPNESGKSTIQRARELALTRRVTSGSGDMDGMRSWSTSDEERPWVRLEFEGDDLDGGQKGSVENAVRGHQRT